MTRRLAQGEITFVIASLLTLLANDDSFNPNLSTGSQRWDFAIT